MDRFTIHVVDSVPCARRLPIVARFQLESVESAAFDDESSAPFSFVSQADLARIGETKPMSTLHDARLMLA